MVEYRGWLLDLYDLEQDGLVLWLLSEDGQRLRLHQAFPVTFYAAGPFDRLRELWRYLRAQSIPVRLERAQRLDLFAGLVDVLAAEVANPALQNRLFQAACGRFPDLDYFDADIPLALRFAARTGVFPLARCQALAAEDGRLAAIEPLDSPWELHPEPPPLRILTIEPEDDPFRAEPGCLLVNDGRSVNSIPLRPLRFLFLRLQAALKRHDPDLILTRWGDTWLFPHLLEICQEAGFPGFNPNREPGRQALQRQAHSFFTYGQVVYRGHQVHLFGRWHIDQTNAVLFGQYGLTGVFEQARVTGLPVQEVARKSPGAGITALQMQAALRRGILVPYQKQQAEDFKSAAQLIQADRGGLVYQPLTGLHQGVAEIDFVSMYPSVMVHFNISPETVGRADQAEAIGVVPELGIPVDRSRVGLVPLSLQPLLAKRLAIKQRLAELDRRDCRYGPLKARADALKWLLVVCFGYLGYKNARFGRIESHEAVTAYGREALLRAKEAAEDLGFTVLHMYVDGLWVQQPGKRTPADFQPLLAEVQARTGLPIALEGIYRWVAFLPSRMDERVPVPNRYFGLFGDGRLKMRGIATRRHDTAPYIAESQLAILQRLAAVPDERPLVAGLATVIPFLQRRLAALRAGQVPPEQLVVTQTLSRLLAEYRMPSPAAQAAEQLQALGRELRPGQRVRFVYLRGRAGVWAWDRPLKPDPASLDGERYGELLLRAACEILQPLGLAESQLRQLIKGHACQLSFPFAVGLGPASRDAHIISTTS